MATLPEPRDHGKPRCGGPRKHNAGPCTRPAGWGTGHAGVGRCKMHGGSTPTHEKAGQRALVEQEARKAFGRLSDVSAPVADPLTALASLAGHVNAWMEFLAGRIGALESLSYDSGFAGEQIRGEIQLWERALDRCNAVFGTAARLNIDERLAAITERQAEVVMAAIEAALDAAQVPAAGRADAKRAAARRLRVVA